MNDFLSGFVALIGCPNVGKSTLLNSLVGQKISIVTNRAQTTRNRITGVYTEKDFQIVFLDTPGLTEPRNKLGEFMQKTAYDSYDAVEAVAFILDGTVGLGDRDKVILDRLTKLKIPVIAVINKSDLSSLSCLNEIIIACKERKQFSDICVVSAKEGKGLPELMNVFRKYLVPGPKYFPDDMVTDQPERIICAEIIREKALMLLKEEIPHGIGVAIDKMETRENGNIMDIYATVYCERPSHKGIIIGAGGRMLKEIGKLSRTDIEELLNLHVNLQIWIKVKDDWRNKPSVLHELGYE